MSACISPCCRRWPTRRRTACANSSSDYVSFSRCTTRNVLTRRSTTRRLPSATRFHRATLTASCARRIMETRTYAGFATMERSNSTAGSSTSTRPWWVSRLAWLKLRVAVGPSATARSCSAPSPIGPMNCENHSPSNNRPERNENCVTHVVGLKCYLCRRLLTPSARRPNLIRKSVPDLRAPASIGGARGRRQYPHPGVADQLQLLAIVSRAVEEFLSGRLAGEGEELRTKCRDGIAQPGAIRRRQFWKRGAVHPRARFHQISQADAMLQQAAILMPLQSLRRELRLVQDLPELVLPVRVVGPLGGGCRPGGGSAQHDAKGMLQQVAQHVRHASDNPTGSATRSLRPQRRRRRRACGRSGPG